MKGDITINIRLQTGDELKDTSQITRIVTQVHRDMAFIGSRELLVETFKQQLATLLESAGVEKLEITE